MLGSDILVKMLIGYGVDTMFGVPGDTNVPLYTSLQRHAGDIRHVMCRDERSAGYMAEGYARISNRVGVFESPSGAGAIYSMPGVAEAFGSSVGVILLTIDIPLKGEGRGVLTELDCVKLFEPVTKASMQIKSADKIPEIMRRAFRVATTGKPGAVQVVVPEDMLLAEVPEESFSLRVETACQRFPALPTLPDPALLGSLLDLISGTAQPKLNKRACEGLMVPVPNAEALPHVEAAISTSLDSVAAARARHSEAGDLRRRMLERAIRGGLV